MRTVIVAAGIVIEAGRVLLSRRKEGTHLAGRWEFPGGKVEPGEDPRAALRRELEEELGVLVRVGEIADVTFHRYDEADKAVLLLFFRAEREEGSPDPRAIDVAEVKWAAATSLDPAEFPAADVAILAKVRDLLGLCPNHPVASASPTLVQVLRIETVEGADARDSESGEA